MKYELFAFDLDGTLLDPSGQLPPTTLDFLNILKAKAHFTLVTGRSLFSARPYIEALKVEIPVVLYHGAVIFHPSEKRVLYEARLPSPVAQKVLVRAQNFPVDVQLYRSVDDPCIYVRQISPQIEEFVKKEGLPVRVVSDWEKVVGGDPLKLLFIGQAAVLLELREALKGLPATVVRSERNYLEVLPPGISKGTGLVWLCEWLGIPLERVVAVGDQESDVSMFERVGLGVAMAHAPEIVRRKAHITIAAIPELQKLLGANAAS